MVLTQTIQDRDNLGMLSSENMMILNGDQSNEGKGEILMLLNKLMNPQGMFGAPVKKESLEHLRLLRQAFLSHQNEETFHMFI